MLPFFLPFLLPVMKVEHARLHGVRKQNNQVTPKKGKNKQFELSRTPLPSYQEFLQIRSFVLFFRFVILFFESVFDPSSFFLSIFYFAYPLRSVLLSTPSYRPVAHTHTLSLPPSCTITSSFLSCHHSCFRCCCCCCNRHTSISPFLLPSISHVRNPQHLNDGRRRRHRSRRRFG